MTLAEWIPPVAKPYARKWSGRGLRFEGSYRQWSDALQDSRGYEDLEILERVIAATRAVVAGEAMAERDGMTLHSVDPPWPVIAGLGSAASQGTLSVVDFGGALGSTYRATKWFLPSLSRWTVIEQPHFVEAGAEFADGVLGFAADFRSVDRDVDVVLFSSVLQYLAGPESICAAATSTRASRVIIDRTPFSLLPDDEITIQRLPPTFYQADYPCHIFGRDALSRLLPGWRVMAGFDCGEGRHAGPSGLFQFRGFILDRQSA